MALTYKEYHDQIRAIATEAIEEWRRQGGTDLREYIDDNVRQNVDSHQFVIYTHYNAQVLTHSSNEDAYFESYGTLEAESYGQAMSKMAYAAMEQDVMEAVGPMIEEVEEEEEEDEDEDE